MLSEVQAHPSTVFTEQMEAKDACEGKTAWKFTVLYNMA